MASTLSVGLFLCNVLAARAVTLRADADKDLVTEKTPFGTPGVQDPHCDCLTWKDAYEVHGAKCGSGYEFGMYGESQWHQPDAWERANKNNNQLIYHQFCNMTFMAMPYKNCFNIKTPTPAHSERQWCYVDKRCHWANPVSPTVGVKWCNETVDEMTNTLMPEMLQVMAMKHAGVDFGKDRHGRARHTSLDLNLLAQLSYARAEATFDKSGACDGREFSKELKAVIASKVPTYYSWDDPLEDGVVVVGHNIYQKIDGPKGEALEDCPECPNPLPLWNKTSMCDVMFKHNRKVYGKS